LGKRFLEKEKEKRAELTAELAQMESGRLKGGNGSTQEREHEQKVPL